MAQAWHAWRDRRDDRVAALHAWVLATRESAEARAQSLQTGRALLDWLRNGRDAADPRISTLAALAPAPTWPEAFALAAVLAGAAARDALLAFGWSWAENQTQAATKAVPLGQAAAQRVLSRLAAALPPHVDAALVCADGDRQAYAPMLAIAAAQHEAQYARLFRS